jgi:hypothetical protein
MLLLNRTYYPDDDDVMVTLTWYHCSQKSYSKILGLCWRRSISRNHVQTICSSIWHDMTRWSIIEVIGSNIQDLYEYLKRVLRHESVNMTLSQCHTLSWYYNITQEKCCRGLTKLFRTFFSLCIWITRGTYFCTSSISPYNMLVSHFLLSSFFIAVMCMTQGYFRCWNLLSLQRERLQESCWRVCLQERTNQNHRWRWFEVEHILSMVWSCMVSVYVT